MIVADLLLAMKFANQPKLESMLMECNKKQYVAKELDLLFYLLPLHLANASYSQTQLQKELNRATKLGRNMLEVLSAVELNRSYSLEIMHHIEDFFRILPHPNPEMRVSQRTDWLSNYAGYKPVIYKPGQLELRRVVFIAAALVFLGQQLLTNMITNADRIATSAPHQGRIKAIVQVLNHSKDILEVFYSKRYSIYYWHMIAAQYKQVPLSEHSAWLAASVWC